MPIAGDQEPSLLLRIGRKLCFGLPLLGLLCLYIFILRPYVVGLWMDDTVYLIGAKSLATGHGYRMISEPSAPAIIKYPPFFPMTLIPIWLLFPASPDNLPIFKLFVIFLGLGVLWAFYLLGRRYYDLSRLEASGLCLVLGVNYVWLRCVVEVLSEPLFMLIMLGLFHFVLRIQAKGGAVTGRQLIGLIFMSCLCFYTRTIGIAFMAGLGWWLWRREGRSTARTYLGACTLGVLAWVGWTMIQPETTDKINGFYVYPENQTYIIEFLIALIKAHGILPILLDAATQFPSSLLLILLPSTLRMPDLPQHPAWIPWSCLVFIGGAFVYSFYRLWRQRQSSVVAYCLWFYLGVVFFWYSHGQYPRLLLCILPFLLLILFRAFKDILNRSSYSKPWSQTVSQGITCATLLLLTGVSLLIPGFSEIPRGNNMALNVRKDLWPDYQAAFSAIRHLVRPEDIVWGRYSGLYYLYTDRKVLNRSLIPGLETKIDWLAASQYRQFYDVLNQVLAKNQVRYLLLEPNLNSDYALEIPETATSNLIRGNPSAFERVYCSPNKVIRLYRYTPSVHKTGQNAETKAISKENGN
jgi:hypothetical protein